LTKSDLFSGRYLFHFHTRLTDGHLSIVDYFRFAAQARVDRLIFLEHIRREPTYDVPQFARSVRGLSASLGIPAAIGFEAKLLPDGSLDIDDAHLALADVIGIAEHRFPPDLSALENALAQCVNHYRRLAPSVPLVWVHPGLTFRKLGFEPREHSAYAALLSWAGEVHLPVEQNLRYGLVSEQLIRDFALPSVVLGADAHTSDDLTNWYLAASSLEPSASSASLAEARR
jgi:putative hydrolase